MSSYAVDELRRLAEKRMQQSISDEVWDDITKELELTLYVAYGNQELNKVLSRLQQEYGMQPPETDPLRVNADGAIARGVLVEHTSAFIGEAVKRFRVEHFGADTPPFASFEEAAQWLEAQASEGDPATEITFDPDALTAQDWTLLQSKDYQALWRSGKIRQKRLTLRYIKAGDVAYTNAVVVSRGVLQKLHKLVHRLIRFWDIIESKALAYILVGIRLYRSPLRCSYSYSQLSNNPKVTLTITDPSVTEKQVIAAYREYRKEVWGVARSNPLSGRDANLVAFIVAEKLFGNDWTEYLRRWRERYPDDDWNFSTKEAMQKAFERAKKRSGFQ